MVISDFDYCYYQGADGGDQVGDDQWPVDGEYALYYEEYASEA